MNQSSNYRQISTGRLVFRATEHDFENRRVAVAAQDEVIGLLFGSSAQKCGGDWPCGPNTFSGYAVATGVFIGRAQCFVRGPARFAHGYN